MAKEKNVEGKLTDSFRGFVAAFLFVALAGCGGLKDDTGTEEVPDEPKTGAVKIITTSTDKLQPISQSLQASVADGPSLTRVPVPTGVNFDYEYWILRGNVNDYETDDAINAAAKFYRPDTLGGDTITLATGSYTLKVKAFPYGTLFDTYGNKIIDDNGMYAGSDTWTDDTAATQAAKGTKAFSISTPGTTTKIDLALEPSGLSGGKGDFIYTITRPTGTNITLELGLLGSTGNPITITPGGAESTTGTGTIEVSNADNKKSTARNIAAGSYGFRILITSTDNPKLVTGWWETVQIYRGMQTLLDIEFDWGDFVDISDGTGTADVGTGPTGITIGNIPGNPGDFTIAWYDGSEKGYVGAVEIDQSKSGYVIAKGPPSGFSDFQWYLQGYDLSGNNPFNPSEGTSMYSVGSTQITLYNTLPVGHYYLTLSAKHTTDNTYYSINLDFTVINSVKDWAKANLGEVLVGSVSGSTVTLKDMTLSPLTKDITVPAGITLVIPASCTLPVSSGHTLAVAKEGKLTVKGVINGGGTIGFGTIGADGNVSGDGGDIVITETGMIEAATTKEAGTLKVEVGGTLITDYKGSTTLVEIVSGILGSRGADGMLKMTGDDSYVMFSNVDGVYHFSGNITIQKTFTPVYDSSTTARTFKFDSPNAELNINILTGDNPQHGKRGIVMLRQGTITGFTSTAENFFTTDTCSGTINIYPGTAADAGFWDVVDSTPVAVTGGTNISVVTKN